MNFEKERKILCEYIIGSKKGFLKEFEVNYLLWLVEWEGIAPLLYMKKKDIPESFKEKLKTLYLKTKIQNEIFISEIIRIADLLEKKGIPLLLLKGSSFIFTLYNDPALRPMTDIDILVKERDLDYVNKMLLNDGYTLIDMEYNTWDRRLGSGRKYVKGNITIDLNTHLESLYIGQEKDEIIFQNAICIGKNIFILNPEDMLIYSLVHMATHHFFYRLIWLYDIKQIVEKFPINWEEVDRRIRKMCSRSLLIAGLKYAEKLLNVDIPSHILAESKDDIFFRKFHGKIAISSNIISFLSIPGIRNKMILLASSLFPSSEYIRVKYCIDSRWKCVLFRMLRPIFVIMKFIEKLY